MEKGLKLLPWIDGLELSGWVELGTTKIGQKQYYHGLLIIIFVY